MIHGARATSFDRRARSRSRYRNLHFVKLTFRIFYDDDDDARVYAMKGK